MESFLIFKEMSSPLVINSIFFKCQEYTLDPFWKDMFCRCAYNRFPKGIRHDKINNIIYVKTPKTSGSRKDQFSLPSKPREVFETMMMVFRSIGLRSPRDLQVKKEEIEAVRKELCVDLNCMWKELRPKYLKDRMIMRYVLYLQELHGLTQKEARRLLTTIQLGFQLKQISSDDVEYKQGKITKIKGLKIDEKAHTFMISREIKPSKKTTKSTNTDSFFQIFENHLKEIKKTKLRL